MTTRRSFMAIAAASSGAFRGAERDAIPRDRYFDLTYRAGAAVHCLTSLLDARQEMLPYFDVRYDTTPPVAVHIRWDYGDGTGRYLDALRLCRMLSGSTENSEADAALERWLFRLIGEDGLSWWPESPYRLPHPSGQPGRMADVTWTQRSTLAALTTLYLETKQDRFAAAGRKLIDRLSGIAVWDGKMAYFPAEAAKYRPGDVLYPLAGWSGKDKLRAGWFGAILGTLIWPLARFAWATGYEPAVRLARGIAAFALEGAEVFQPDGSFRDRIQGHFYARTTTAHGLLRLGILTATPSYIAMAERIYLHAKTWGTSFGWFPEDLSVAACETCCIKDMIELAIGLARFVHPKYWDDAERFGRNHLLESQLLDTSWVAQYKPARPYVLPVEDESRISRDRVMERWRGGFAGWSGINDWTSPGRGGMACCNASGARALYDLWHSAVTHEGAAWSVNLLFDRATPALTVRSSVPFEGSVELQIRTGAAVRVRIPAYADAAAVTVEKNGRPLRVAAPDPWLRLPSLRAGDMVRIRFNLPERHETVHLGYQSYEVRYRGDTVLTVTPPGQVSPLYRRGWIADHRLTRLAAREPAGEIDSI